ncbi:MAG TPA: electron transfer flavoprotein subunit alpha/FixB family protein, partial [Xanthobacteraceae bacterium]
MTTLLLAEHDNTHLKEATAKALTAAGQLGGDVHLLVAGSRCRSVAEEAAKLDGVAKVLLADAPPYEHFLPECVAELLKSVAGSYDALVAPSTANGRNIMPRLAALLDVMQISDMMKVVGPDTFERPVFAGNVIETVRSRDAKKVFTVRTTAFQAAGNGGTASIEA